MEGLPYIISYQVFKIQLVGDSNSQPEIEINARTRYYNDRIIGVYIEDNGYLLQNDTIELKINGNVILPEGFKAEIIARKNNEINKAIFRINEVARGSEIQIKYKNGVDFDDSRWVEVILITTENDKLPVSNHRFIKTIELPHGSNRINGKFEQSVEKIKGIIIHQDDFEGIVNFSNSRIGISIDYIDILPKNFPFIIPTLTRQLNISESLQSKLLPLNIPVNKSVFNVSLENIQSNDRFYLNNPTLNFICESKLKK